MLKTLSRYFRIALEGATTDGRQIEREQIIQMARNFNPEKYGARIWLEQIRGVLPEGPFQAYGDVVALKSEEIEMDGIQKMALFAQVEPTPELVAMNRKKQKMYTSIELDPNFADTGEAYLVGLGITDSPASLGTEMLCFAARNTPEHNPLRHRKQRPENLFSEAIPVELEFEEIPTAAPSFLETVRELVKKFSGKATTDPSRLDDLSAATTQLLAYAENLSSELARTTAHLNELHTRLEEHESAFALLQQQLAREPEQPDRPLATGSSNETRTDC